MTTDTVTSDQGVRPAWHRQSEKEQREVLGPCSKLLGTTRKLPKIYEISLEITMKKKLHVFYHLMIKLSFNLFLVLLSMLN